MKKPRPQQISAASNPKLKGLRKLRVGFGKSSIVVEGWKLINEALRSGLVPQELWATNEADTPLDCTTFLIPPSLYQGISPTKHGQPPLAVFAAPQIEDIVPQQLRGPTLLLDQVQDPGNAGALVRAAAAFGFQQIIWHKPSIYPFHHACIRASAGTVFHAHHTVLDTSSITDLTGSLIGAELEGTALPEFKWPTTPILVMGNEGHGLSSVIAQKLQKKVTIPMQACAESLNVSGAAHILMYDFAIKRVSS